MVLHTFPSYPVPPLPASPLVPDHQGVAGTAPPKACFLTAPALGGRVGRAERVPLELSAAPQPCQRPLGN